MILRLKKQRRGQIRAVDFIVSLLLFLLMLSQLILITINVQSGIRSNTLNAITYEELDSLGLSLIQESGDAFWGYKRTLPSNFGLSSDYLNSYLALDPSKIARIITGTSFPVTSISGFEMFTYETLKTLIALKSGWDFQLSLEPLFKVEVNIIEINNTANNVIINVRTHFNNPISNAKAHLFVIDLISGSISINKETITDSSGETSKDYLIPNINDPNREHIIVVLVKKGTLWGIQWAYQRSNEFSENVIIGENSNTTIWGGGLNSSTLLITDILEISTSPDSHYISVIYENTNEEFNNQTIDITSKIDGNETIKIPTDGLVVFLSITRTDNNFRVGIGTYPAILDRDQTKGNFYKIFGKNILGERIKTMLSKTYPVIVRGTLMQCHLTLWSE